MLWTVWIKSMNSNCLLTLAEGPLEVSLAAERGGAITSFHYVAGGTRSPVLRSIAGMPVSVLEAASFPLVPYSNRIRGGRFSFRGREIVLTANMPPDASPLHGQGWLAAWTVLHASQREAQLLFEHQRGEWPWRYEARQAFALDPGGLSLRLSCMNLDDEPMPCGLGQHPYFPCTADTRLDTEVEGVWEIDDKVLPVGRLPATGRYDLSDRLVCGQGLDHGFDGWSGTARIESPALPFRIEISSPTARCFQLYSPAEGGLFVAEPVTHTNAALNAPEQEWPKLGLEVLEPGEEMVLDARIAVIAASQTASQSRFRRRAARK
jgi:aldose 1-epimerase